MLPNQVAIAAVDMDMRTPAEERQTQNAIAPNQQQIHGKNTYTLQAGIDGAQREMRRRQLEESLNAPSNIASADNEGQGQLPDVEEARALVENPRPDSPAAESQPAETVPKQANTVSPSVGGVKNRMKCSFPGKIRLASPTATVTKADRPQSPKEIQSGRRPRSKNADASALISGDTLGLKGASLHLDAAEAESCGKNPGSEQPRSQNASTAEQNAKANCAMMGSKPQPQECTSNAPTSTWVQSQSDLATLNPSNIPKQHSHLRHAQDLQNEVIDGIVKQPETHLQDGAVACGSTGGHKSQPEGKHSP